MSNDPSATKTPAAQTAAQAANQPTKAQVAESSLESRIAALERRELEIAEREKSLQAKEAAVQAANGLPVDKAALPLGHDTGWLFRVGPVLAKHKKLLSPSDIRAVDETEAKRVYLLTHADPNDESKSLDAAVYELDAVCMEEAQRIDAQRAAGRLANIRAKRASGQPLRSEEERLIQAADDKILEERLRRSGQRI